MKLFIIIFGFILFTACQGLYGQSAASNKPDPEEETVAAEAAEEATASIPPQGRITCVAGRAGVAGAFLISTGAAIPDVVADESDPEENLDNAEEALPGEYSLGQNYPNPFNPATVIQYALPSDAKVRLVIYDVLGQIVTTLAEGVQTAGYKELRWDATGAASGVYFYRIEATGITDPAQTFTQVRKMMLVK